MSLLTSFTARIERSRMRCRRVGVLVMAALLMASLFGARVGYAQTAQSKIAPNQQSVISANTTPSRSRVKDAHSSRYLKAPVTAQPDPTQPNDSSLPGE